MHCGGALLWCVVHYGDALCTAMACGAKCTAMVSGAQCTAMVSGAQCNAMACGAQLLWCVVRNIMHCAQCTKAHTSFVADIKSLCATTLGSISNTKFTR